MSDTKETIQAARGWHKLGLVVSATALALLLAPLKTDYKSALDEAYALRDLRLSNHESFVRNRGPAPLSLLPNYDAAVALNNLDFSFAISAFVAAKVFREVRQSGFPNPTW